MKFETAAIGPGATERVRPQQPRAKRTKATATDWRMQIAKIQKRIATQGYATATDERALKIARAALAILEA